MRIIYAESHGEDTEKHRGFSANLCAFSAVLCATILFSCINLKAQAPRQQISLNNDWLTIATTNDKELPADLYKAPVIKDWKKVNIPHNWDAYEGYRRLLHGNRHGNAWYKKTFSTRQSKTGKRFFL